MNTKGVVTEVSGDRATVRVKRHAACDGCHRAADGRECTVCTLLGGKSDMTAVAANPLGAVVGQTVELSASSSRILWYAVAVFLLPLFFGLGGYFLGGYFFDGELPPYLVSLGAFLFSFFLLWLYSARVVKGRCDVEIVNIII